MFSTYACLHYRYFPHCRERAAKPLYRLGPSAMPRATDSGQLRKLHSTRRLPPGQAHWTLTIHGPNYRAPPCSSSHTLLTTKMSVSKHIINDPRELAHESLRGLVKSDAALALEDDSKVVFLKNVPQDRVALVGTEPGSADGRSRVVDLDMSLHTLVSSDRVFFLLAFAVTFSRRQTLDKFAEELTSSRTTKGECQGIHTS